MSGGEVRPLPDADLRRALQITCSAFADAMREHGLLPGTIQLISLQAERNVEEVLGMDDGPS